MFVVVQLVHTLPCVTVTVAVVVKDVEKSVFVDVLVVVTKTCGFVGCG